MTDQERAEAVQSQRWEGDHNIESPFNACMHKSYCISLKAEPVQEPVAWSFELATTRGEHGYADWSGRRVTQFKPNVPEGSIRNLTPLYTAPPQRKPLTQEEIAAEWRKASECAGKSEGAVTTSQFVEMFARAVEAKHGIKESP